MATSKRTYVDIAAEIHNLIDREQSSGMPSEDYFRGITDSVRKLADVLKADNHSFRYDTFFAACGLDSWGYLPESDIDLWIKGEK